MTNRIIYLVMERVNYEGSFRIKAFAKREDALLLKEAIDDYPDCPDCPPLLDSQILAEATDDEWDEAKANEEKNNAEWEKYGVEVKQWEKNHPAGESHRDGDDYGIEELEVF